MKRNQRRRVVVTVSAVQPTQRCPDYTVTRFYSVKPEHADAMAATGRARLARQLALDLSAVAVTTAPFKKLRYHWQPPRGGDASEYNKGRAIAYARWLAARDGITIPPGLEPRAVWSGFYSAHLKTRRKFWSGVKECDVWCKRVRAVEFGRTLSVEIHDKRNRFKGYRDEWVCEMTIPIPHWDFEPREPIEEVEQAMAA